MKSNVLRKSYEYISFLRHNLADLCNSLGLSYEEFSILDSDLKSLLTSIDDLIFARQTNRFCLNDITPHDEV